MATREQMEASEKVCWTGPCAAYGDEACVCAQMDRAKSRVDVGGRYMTLSVVRSPRA